MILFIGQRMENERAQNHAVHSGSEYAFATTLFASSGGLYGTGIVLTLGEGNQLVCEAIELLGKGLIGQEIEELMARLRRRHAAPGTGSRNYAGWDRKRESCILRSLRLTNACFDLWAKARGVPLWRLLLDLTPRAVVNLLDLSYLEDVLPREEAEASLQQQLPSRAEREANCADARLSRIRHVSRLVPVRRQSGEGSGARGDEPRVSRLQT